MQKCVYVPNFLQIVFAPGLPGLNRSELAEHAPDLTGLSELNYNLNCVVETTLLTSNRSHSAQVAILQSHAWSLLPLLFLALFRFLMAEHSSTQK